LRIEGEAALNIRKRLGDREPVPGKASTGLVRSSGESKYVLYLFSTSDPSQGCIDVPLGEVLPPEKLNGQEFKGFTGLPKGITED
jgi:hypothetical protein